MGLTDFLAQHITRFMESTGYITVLITMVMESMVFPVPSEAVMPFAGFLVAEGKFTFILVVLISTIGSLIGSLISYAVGYYCERALIHKYGMFVLLDKEELDATESFFGRYGEATIFISRFIPVVRHLISLPAGFSRMNIYKFCLFTVVGAGIWNGILAYTGFYLKNNWEAVMRYSRYIDMIVLLFLAGLIMYFVYKHVSRHLRKKKIEK
jgi:membrane protein DedA with SNARE-associated domain